MSIKTFVVISIFLIINLTIFPAFSADITKNMDLVDLSVEFFGYNYKYFYKSKISIEQARGLDLIFESLEDKLENSENESDSVAILKETVWQLKNLGITDDNLLQDMNNLFENINYNIFTFEENDLFSNVNKINNNQNFLCLISGKTTNCTMFIPRIFLPTTMTYIGLILAMIISMFTGKNPLYIAVDLFLLYGAARMLFPPDFMSIMILGIDKYKPAEGWIWTMGLNGVKKWSGKFYGSLSDRAGCIASNYFSGLKIVTNIEGQELGGAMLLGFVDRISIDYDYPWS